MASVKTFRVNGSLTYNEMDDNTDNLNNDKIERVLTVNDSQAALNITQTGSGKALIINTDDVVVNADGKIGLGTTTPRVSLDIAGTDAISVTVGTTAERPTTPKEGDFRFNKTTKTGEMFDGKFWTKMSRLLNIEKVSAGYNGFQLFGEGEIYTTSGTAGWVPNTLGRGTTVFAPGLNNFMKVLIPESSKIVDSGSLGAYGAAYALLENGNLYTWGINSRGQCGDGTTTPVLTPKLVQTDVVEVYTDHSNGSYSVDDSRLIIRKTDGYLWGVGYNGYGTFATGTATPNVTTFTRLTAFGTGFKSVWNLGTTYGCLIVQKTNGQVLISGGNLSGYFGDGTTTQTNTGGPRDVTAAWLPDASYDIKYASGSFGYHTGSAANSASMLLIYAENPSGAQSIRTAGANDWGGIGNNSASSVNITTPYTFPITLTKTIKQVKYIGGIATGYILTTDGNLYSWGYNPYGQVGNNSVSNTGTVTLVLTDVKSLPITGFNSHTHGYYTTMFAVKNDGSVWASGYGQYGQACNGTLTVSNQTFTRCLIPTYPDNTLKIIAVNTTTGTGTCMIGIREDNEIFGWGYNSLYGVSSDSASNNHWTSAGIFKIKRT